MNKKFHEYFENIYNKEQSLKYLVGYDDDGNMVKLPKNLLTKKFPKFFKKKGGGDEIYKRKT